MNQNTQTLSDLIEYEEEPLVTEKLVFNNQQAMWLALNNCIEIEGKTWYKKSRHDFWFQAEQLLQPGEIIADSRTAVFILSPFQNKCIKANHSLMA